MNASSLARFLFGFEFTQVKDPLGPHSQPFNADQRLQAMTQFMQLPRGAIFGSWINQVHQDSQHLRLEKW